MKYLLIAGFIAGFVIASVRRLYAQDVILDRYVQQAVDNNPGLQAKFKDYYAALEKVPQVGALPDPKVVLGYYISPVETRLGPRVFDVQLSQSFPWFGTLKAKKDEASKWAAVKYQVFLQAKNNLIYDIKSRYYELYFAQKSIDIRKDYLSFLKRDEKVTLAQVKGDKAGIDDIIRIQMAIDENQTQLESLIDKKQTASARLNSLLNQPINRRAGVTDTLLTYEINPDDQRMLDSVLSRNPLINQLREQASALDSRMDVARKSGFPNLGAGISYGDILTRQDMNVQKNGKDVLMPMVSITIPLYRSKYKAMVKEASLEKENARLSVENLKNTLSAELVTALNQYRDAERNIHLYNTLIVKANQTLQIITAAYMVGKEDYVEVLRIEQQLLDYRLNLCQATVDQNTSIALLNKLLAKELP